MKTILSHNIPTIRTKAITTPVTSEQETSNSVVSCTGDHVVLNKNPELMPKTLTKLTTEEICAARGDDQNFNISSLPPAGMDSANHSLYPSVNIKQQFTRSIKFEMKTLSTKYDTTINVRKKINSAEEFLIKQCLLSI